MARQADAQARLEELQAARTARLDEIENVNQQIATLEAKQAALESAAAEAGSADVPELMATLGTMASLRRVLKSLRQGKSAIDDQIAGALADVNRIEIGKLHRKEREVWDRVISAARDLKAQVADLEAVHREIHALHGSTWANVPEHLDRALSDQAMKRWTPGRFQKFDIEAYEDAS
jgi:chromosome segregation ATPase